MTRLLAGNGSVLAEEGGLDNAPEQLEEVLPIGQDQQQSGRSSIFHLRNPS